MTLKFFLLNANKDALAGILKIENKFINVNQLTTDYNTRSRRE